MKGAFGSNPACAAPPERDISHHPHTRVQDTMRFFRCHAIGNDYIVIRESDRSRALGPSQIRRICHRNFGIGSDGILPYRDTGSPARFPPLPSHGRIFSKLISGKFKGGCPFLSLLVGASLNYRTLQFLGHARTSSPKWSFAFLLHSGRSGRPHSPICSAGGRHARD